MLHSNYSILPRFASTDMSASIMGPIIDLNLYNIASITVNWVGTAQGCFHLEGSNEIAESIASVTDASFDMVPNSRVFIIADGKQSWNFILPLGFRWLRVVWMYASGSNSRITACNITVRGSSWQ